jgi:hypothetical protein
VTGRHRLGLRHRRNPKGLLTIGRDDFHYGNFGADVGHYRNMRLRVGRFPDRNPATIKLTQRYYGWGITIPNGLIQKVERRVNRDCARVP